jgi:Uma2 family endonuclease
MAVPAIRPMTLDEFLRWDDGTDTRYELVGGFPVAMAPPMQAHGILAARLAGRIDAALAARRPCRVGVEVGVVDPARDDTSFVADIGVTCAPFDPRSQYMPELILVVEILSPSTERHDRRVKVPVYQRIPSVQEILLVDSEEHYAELHRRQGDQWIIQISIGPAAVIALASVGSEISMSELYEGLIAAEEQPA